MITIEQMVQREVNCCLSSLVSTLAQANGLDFRGKPANRLLALSELVEQAAELAAPVDDWEETALQDGWEAFTDKFGVACWRYISSGGTWAGSAQDLCDAHAIDPYQWEVYEHWSVSTWLAEKLLAQGEKVDTDFASMNVWARTTTGQGIANDSCIEKIYAELIR